MTWTAVDGRRGPGAGQSFAVLGLERAVVARANVTSTALLPDAPGFFIFDVLRQLVARIRDEVDVAPLVRTTRTHGGKSIRLVAARGGPDDHAGNPDGLIRCGALESVTPSAMNYRARQGVAMSSSGTTTGRARGRKWNAAPWPTLADLQACQHQQKTLA